MIAGRGLIGLRTRSAQQRIGTCRARLITASAVHQLRDLVVKRTIDPVAFETQALVGLFAFRTRKQRSRHRPRAKIVSFRSPRSWSIGHEASAASYPPEKASPCGNIVVSVVARTAVFETEQRVTER